jgi:hypothetical protein
LRKVQRYGTEVKNYLRVDHTEDDSLILSLMDTAKKLVKDVGRMDEQAFTVNEEITRQAMLPMKLWRDCRNMQSLLMML